MKEKLTLASDQSIRQMMCRCGLDDSAKGEEASKNTLHVQMLLRWVRP